MNRKIKQYIKDKIGHVTCVVEIEAHFGEDTQEFLDIFRHAQILGDHRQYSPKQGAIKMNIIDQARAAFEKHQASPHQYKYSQVEKSTWINGYVSCALEKAEEKLKELSEPSPSDLDVSWPEVVEIPHA